MSVGRSTHPPFDYRESSPCLVHDHQSPGPDSVLETSAGGERVTSYRRDSVYAWRLGGFAVGLGLLFPIPIPIPFMAALSAGLFLVCPWLNPKVPGPNDRWLNMSLRVGPSCVRFYFFLFFYFFLKKKIYGRIGSIILWHFLRCLRWKVGIGINTFVVDVL